MSLEPWQWALAAVGAFAIGVSKTGIGGLAMLAVVIFANLLPAKASSGFVLPMLVLGDFVAVTVYRRHAVWSHLWRLFPWAALGVVLGYLTMGRIDNRQAGWLIGGTLFAAVTGLLWGGLVRVFVLHHFTYSINSLCHVFGNRDFETTDQSRNLALIAIPTFGEAWHNNHHAFPTSATHGLGRWQVDISAIVIDSLEKLNLVWDVVRVSPERLAAKAV